MEKQQARLYDHILAEQIQSHRQMAFVTGPRQVGKTTSCRSVGEGYVNWDNLDDRAVLLSGPGETAHHLKLDRLQKDPVVAVLDELHKYRRWKSFLKGFFDTYADRVRLLVTGSSRLDLFRKSGDSLMGRYFLYRMHPFSVAETVYRQPPDPKTIIRPPRKIAPADFNALWEHGGFPEPFLKRDPAFTRRWSRLRQQQLLREDVREMTRIHEISQLESLVGYLEEWSGDQIIYSNLAGRIQTSVDTVRRWIDILCGLYLGFLLKPWYRNVTRSLRKEPKWYLHDWSRIVDEGKRAETFVACHLLKAVEGWTDLGIGDFQLGYLRDKEKREVDFIIVRDRKPWVLVEVKKSEDTISPSLGYYQQQTGAPYAFQAIMDAAFIDADCFARPGPPITVPAVTFLSQLL
ncbi:MAG TPA: AAA family ATPase [Acidobacteriota bacterium]|nr:AAA family ATPase [Acidobacteriota bacterium]